MMLPFTLFPRPRLRPARRCARRRAGRTGLLRFAAGRSSESGSAYLIALVVLIVVTVLGLGLAFVTQTELLIGANERVVQKISYAAESGIAVSTALTLVRKYKEPFNFELNDPPDHATGLQLTTLIELGPSFPIFATPCNLCQINNEMVYNADAYFRVNHLMASRASLESAGTVTARKQMTIMLEAQPWDDKSPPTSVLKETGISTGISRLEFIDESAWWRSITP